MWDNDCGVVPVVEDGGKVVGVITDRDICMAAAMTGRSLPNITVDEVTNRQVYSCNTDDSVLKALEIMGERKVRRLPVVDNNGQLQGIVSMNDIALRARPTADRKTELSFDAAMKAYQAICSHTRTAAEPGSMAATV
jgi:predicted transcriptional regulator